ncbi:hypothetical protein R1flu_028941 [Riccia fluitans]|uniref:Uncharacterized protein n=1 Tax=Riccia fluitans TaxID=41844 RepID=A0ABD1XNS5_9MARC
MFCKTSAKVETEVVGKFATANGGDICAGRLKSVTDYGASAGLRFHDGQSSCLHFCGIQSLSQGILSTKAKRERPTAGVDPQEESRLADILISDAGMTNTMLPGLDQIVVHMFQEEGSSEITLGRQALKGRVVSKHVPLVVECPCGGREVQIFKLELVDGLLAKVSKVGSSRRLEWFDLDNIWQRMGTRKFDL